MPAPDLVDRDFTAIGLRSAADSAPAHAIHVLGPLLIHDRDRDLGPRDLGGVRPKQVLLGRVPGVPGARRLALIDVLARRREASGSWYMKRMDTHWSVPRPSRYNDAPAN